MKSNIQQLLGRFLLVSAMLAGGVGLRAQTVTKTFRNVPLKTVLKEVERQTKLSFVYRSSDLNVKRRVTANFKETPLTKVLATVLGNEADYEVKGGIVTIRKTAKPRNPQQKSSTVGDKKHLVTGHVSDSSGEPLIGVAVRSAGTSAGTVTDIDGNFTIMVPANDMLRVSYIGYNDQEVSLGSRQRVSITMQESQQALDEVVVVGYGTATRRSITGAVDQVRSDMLEDRPVANVTQALQGAAPNLIIQRKSYNPNGENNNLNIRGISTTNSNSPLIVIDGLASSDGALNELNPNDIDNISILKDAGAAAIYGSRSSNGVILVTTKKGRVNTDAHIRLTTAVGWEDPDILFTPVAGYQNATLKNVALMNSGMSPEFTPEQIRDLYNHRSEESWFLPQIFRTALQQNHNVSVTGGSAKTTYMVSVGYYNQESNYVGNKNFGIQRYNVRSNLTTELGPVKLQALMAFTRNNSLSTTGSSLEIDAERVPPY